MSAEITINSHVGLHRAAVLTYDRASLRKASRAGSIWAARVGIGETPETETHFGDVIDLFDCPATGKPLAAVEGTTGSVSLFPLDDLTPVCTPRVGKEY